MFSNLFSIIRNFFTNGENQDNLIKREVSFQEYKKILKKSSDLDKIEEVTIEFSTTDPGEGTVLMKLEKPDNYSETKRITYQDKPITMRKPKFEEYDRG